MGGGQDTGEPLTRRTAFAAGIAVCAIAATAHAGTIESPAEGDEPSGPPEAHSLDIAHTEQIDPGTMFHLGGAIRVNAYRKSWENPAKRGNISENVRLDTVMIDLDFKSGRWDGSAQYRVYYYSDTGRTTHFPHHAWVGYQLDEHQKIQAGIQKVPFGLLPFASNNFFFSLAFYAGLEDDYDAGFNYRRQQDGWTIDASYFPADEGSWSGHSNASARYSYDIVPNGTRENRERHQVNLRLARAFSFENGIEGEAGLSLQYGLLPNGITGRNGHQNAEALHADIHYGNWNLKTETIRYRYDVANPPSQDDRYVIMGAFDFPYRVAAGGQFYIASLSYGWDIPGKLLDSITVYNDYSYLKKTEAGFSDSQQEVIGAGFDFDGPLYVSADIALGQNNAYIGPNFTNAMAAGNGDSGWSSRLNLNVALYF